MAAKRKAKTGSGTKKGAKSAAPVKRRAAKKEPKLLTEDERNRLLKPTSDFRNVVEDTIEVWTAGGKGLRVPGRSPGQLRSLLRKATTASDREEKLRREVERKVAKLVDARMLAHHAVWNALLDVYSAVRGSRSAPQLQEAFAFLAESFRKGGRKPAAPEQQGGPKPQPE